MSRHERGFRLVCTCEACDGDGYLLAGWRGPNDPDVREVTCPECDGVGEVMAEETEIDEDEEME